MKTAEWKYDFAVVVPVYESEQLVLELAKLLAEIFKELNKTYQLILVDDSKQNTTWRYVKIAHEQNPSVVTAIRLARNYGQHNATVCGFGYVDAPWVITMDDDLEVLPNQIPRLINRQKETQADVVSGSYRRNKGNIIYRFLNQLIADSGDYIINQKTTKSSFRLIETTLAQQLLNDAHRLIFIDQMLLRYTQSFENVMVVRSLSPKDKSAYSFSERLLLLSNALLLFSTIPIRLMSLLAVIIALFTFAIGTFTVYKKIFYNTPMGYASLICAVLFSTSILLFSLSVIGENLRKISVVLNQEPVFRIRKVLS